MRHVISTITVSAIAVVFSPAAAVGDPISITSGQAVVQPAGGGTLVRVTVSGDNFAAAIRWTLGFVLPQTVCPEGCRPGDVLSLNTMVFHEGPINTEGLDNDTVGSATLNGVSYPSLAFAGSLTFVGPTVTLPPASGAPGITLTGPFTASGTILGYDASGREPQLLFTADLLGSGTATAGMPFNPNNQTYAFGTLTYDFAAPVPEPVTGVLAGAGLALILARRRQHKGGAASG